MAKYEPSEWQFESKTIEIYPAAKVSEMTVSQLRQALCFMIENQENVSTKLYDALEILSIER